MDIEQSGAPERHAEGPRIVVGPDGAVLAGGLDLEMLAQQLARLALAPSAASGLSEIGTHDGAPPRLSTADLDHALAALGRVRDAAGALEARLLTSRDARSRADEAATGTPEAERGRTVALETAIASRRGLADARRRLRASHRLVTDMPLLFAALAHGQIDESAALAVGRSVGPLRPDERAQIDEHLSRALPYMDSASPGEWAREAGRVAHQLDPAGHAGRAVRAGRERSVSVRPAPHGMADLHAHLPALEATAIRKRLSLEAERLRARGDRRGHGAIMADLLCDHLLGRADGTSSVRIDLGVVITERSLMEPSHGEPAMLEGYGPVAAEVVPDWVRHAPEAVMRRLFTHPTSGELVAVESRSRAVPEGLARLVRWRDQRCRAPFCDAPVREIDHARPWSRGGSTSLENLQGLCRHCNSIKELLPAVRPGRIIGRHVTHWETSTGRVAHASAPRLVDPPSPAAVNWHDHRRPQRFTDRQ